MSTNTLAELDEFRAQWKQEVTSRQQTKTAASDLVRQTASLSLTPPKNDTPGNTLVNTEDNDEPVEEEEEEEEPVTALGLYSKAVDHERQGQLGKALFYYRRAFRLNGDIDHDYKQHYQSNILAELEKEEEEFKKRGGSSGDHGGEGSDRIFRHIIPMGIEYEQPAIQSSSWQDPLASLIEEFSEQDTDFMPALDYKPVLIAKLPNEIILTILKHLFLKSLSSSAKVALVCKRFFLLTRSPTIWRYLCEHAYRPPGKTLADSQRIQSAHVQHYGSWYHMYIQRPRIRYDGVYIATCHYIRPGTSDTAWNQPIHLVTYYRYLRFFTDGKVIIHVTTEEPAQVVSRLDQTCCKQQTFHGYFRWTEEAVLQLDIQDDTLPFERFFLQLDVRGTHRGRHNKLAWRKYTSVNQRKVEQEEHVYDLKMMKSYFFSPVRSYRVDYPHHDDDRV
ncbi:hypothetical protein BC941DRAFT_431310 [Chlamydoabsidia padenii]|nr:hypothetical protein BC941DRAFT_431310 [Chlamydoabsidia padenii]